MKYILITFKNFDQIKIYENGDVTTHGDSVKHLQDSDLEDIYKFSELHKAIIEDFNESI